MPGAARGSLPGNSSPGGPAVVGLDISLAMLRRAAATNRGPCRAAGGGRHGAPPLRRRRLRQERLRGGAGVHCGREAGRRGAFRVTKPGGVIVVATLNSLSPWAATEREDARRDPDSIFNRVFFRSPAQLLAAAPVPGIVRTAVHFGKEDDPADVRPERTGRRGARPGPLSRPAGKTVTKAGSRRLVWVRESAISRRAARIGRAGARARSVKVGNTV